MFSPFDHSDIQNFSSITGLFYIVLDDSEYPVKLSKNWEELLGIPLETLYKTSYWDFIAPDDLKKTCINLLKVANGTNCEFTTSLINSEGKRLVMLWSARKAEGSLIYGVAQEVTKVLKEDLYDHCPTREDLQEIKNKLTETESKIFEVLESAQGRVTSKNELTEKVYGNGGARSLSVHIHNLRKKLVETEFQIKNVGKAGWTLVQEGKHLKGVERPNLSIK